MNKLSAVLAIIFALIFLTSLGGCNKANGSNFIDDRARLLSDHEKERITLLCEKLLEDLDIHIKVVTLRKRPLDINQKAVDIFAGCALGEKTRGAKGVLFLVDPEGRQVRLEIGYDLEPIFTDGFTGYIERGQMVPFFQTGRVGAGIEATVELLVGRSLGTISTSDQTLNLDDSSGENHYSGGGGAIVRVEIGSGAPEKKPASSPQMFGAQSSPRMALKKYMKVLALHIKDPDLGLYTPETREFFRQWTVTDAQQDNSLRGLERVTGYGILFRHDDLAVIRFPVTDRNASPYFFRKGNDGWMIDFATMNKTIRFNHKNQWLFSNVNHDFMFGFDGLIFDKNGFPHKKH
ncbi:MAG: TPM domain-containing protein [Thermodesulfobacteriota bacterium]|nr:TPM domain-containing protein [Thermodesulfobacteriota bacterium]